MNKKIRNANKPLEACVSIGTSIMIVIERVFEYSIFDYCSAVFEPACLGLLLQS